MSDRNHVVILEIESERPNVRPFIVGGACGQLDAINAVKLRLGRNPEKSIACIETRPIRSGFIVVAIFAP